MADEFSNKLMIE